ncbi:MULTISPECIES: hypothetical protein [Laceyella]|jgi:hypothetical protein|uniref:Uncharacterized protein n=1 Tax=Laceyella sediminis TaxID=573074 RepID=A0ABX5ES88_9BACL|nr:hypothetical protein [Laceyella sediminis]MRG28643.1 hypothetical protein [Laceyella tengchongensis]PRZ16444.1 hypothetical protein CLV36_102153 [Laceyella sediminis]
MDMIMIGGGAVVLVVAVIIIVSVIVGKKRKQEVEELEKMFPDGSMSSDNIKISVEKVRRTTMERERRKKQRIHRERPKEGQKTLPYEDQEIIYRDDIQGGELNKDVNDSQGEKETVSESKRSSRTRSNLFKSRGKKQADDLDKTQAQEAETALDGEGDKTLAVRKKTRKTSREMPVVENEPAAEENTDAAKSRRLYKRSLLKASDENRETSQIPKASLIDTQMYVGEDEQKEEQKSTLSRSQAKGGRNWFKK